jgi:ferrous iron transport protein A
MAMGSPWKALLPALLPRGEAAGTPQALPASNRLDALATGREGRVVGVQSPDSLPEWSRWLGEIGFLPGERVTVMNRSVWGGDPLVVRVGQSTFALRRAEAACVEVEPV